MLALTLWARGPAASDDKSGQASIQFAETSHDFGYIREADGAVSHTFVFENVGEEPLVIVSASASCGCTRPDYPTAPVKPGKKGKLKVTFSPLGRPGAFRKSVTVRCNGRHKKVTLYIDGSVIPADKK